MSKILEKDIEKLIQDSIIPNGYRQSLSSECDRDNCEFKTTYHFSGSGSSFFRVEE